jgi:hypothetical protein
VYGVGGAYFHTLSAKLAFLGINVSEVVFEGDGLKWAYLNAFTATYAGHLAIFSGYGTFFFIYARNKNSAVFFALGSQLYDATGTCFNAGSAGCAFIVYFRQTGFGIDVYGIELTGLHTVSQAEAAIRTSSLARKSDMSKGTAVNSLIGYFGRGVGVRPVASHHRNHWLCFLNFQPHDFTYLFHDFYTPHRAIKAFKGTCVDY